MDQKFGLLGLSLALLLPAAMTACGSSSGAPGGGGGGGGGGAGGGGGGAGVTGGSLGKCSVFPADNPWNQDISGLAVDKNSAAYMATMNAGTAKLHPDFGSDPSYGIPYVTVPGSQPKVAMTFDTAEESDPGPYPFPPNAPIEQGDGHVLVVDTDNCILYETYDSSFTNPGWHAGSGAVFDFSSNKLRPDGWTSADAAGLPILPGLARYDEAVTTGAINHALRFTANTTQNAFVHPATHGASSNTSASTPPMGIRVRLQASYDLSSVTGASKVILTALKKYGMYLADNGSNWYISGSTDTRWNDDDLNQIKKVSASAFEVVEVGTIVPQPK